MVLYVLWFLLFPVPLSFLTVSPDLFYFLVFLNTISVLFTFFIIVENYIKIHLYYMSLFPHYLPAVFFSPSLLLMDILFKTMNLQLSYYSFNFVGCILNLLCLLLRPFTAGAILLLQGHASLSLCLSLIHI